MIYHGSEHVIEVPVWGQGKKYNDYGCGFYCTEELDMAREWAVSKDRNGFVNCYELNLEGLKVLDLREEQYCILHWLVILLNNRTFDMPSLLALEAKDYLLKHFFIDVSQYDVIIGYRGDNYYFSYAQDFLNGSITYRQLENTINSDVVENQVVLISEKAFVSLKYIGKERVGSKKWFERKCVRNSLVMRDYFETKEGQREKRQNMLGSMLDYAVHDLHYDIEEIWEMFLYSEFSEKISEGDFGILVGKSGIELAYDVIYQNTEEYLERQPVLEIERQPAKWTGRMLAYYQWHTSLPFEEITESVPIQEVHALYTPYHEEEIEQFVDEMNRLYLEYKKETNLKIRRTRLGLSQRELSELADVSFRTIQQYEQRQKDVNRASGETLIKLAKTLGCGAEDLIEKVKKSNKT